MLFGAPSDTPRTNTRALCQVLIKNLRTDEQIDLAVQILQSQALVLMTDYKGHYLIVLLIEHFPYEKFSFIGPLLSPSPSFPTHLPDP